MLSSLHGSLDSRLCCINERLVMQVLLSPDYLPAMRRRRSSDPMGDTASNLGNAMDELMRHQPSLKQAATKAIITLLEEVKHEKYTYLELNLMHPIIL